MKMCIRDSTGCGDCQRACLFDAIAGSGEGKRSIIEWNCTGCGKCVDSCKHGGICLLYTSRCV